MTSVLLVEDDAWLSELESRVLTKEGYEVVTAPHALAAIDLIDQKVPDVIVLDVLLAGSTAFALLNELQSHGDTNRTPIILCTNLAEQFDSAKLAEYGVKRVVDKSTMHPNDLVVAVKAVLG
ncbi:MAG: response regulator transcription factor [Candidatus Microsaccharimonas sp.]